MNGANTRRRSHTRSGTPRPRLTGGLVCSILYSAHPDEEMSGLSTFPDALLDALRMDAQPKRPTRRCARPLTVALIWLSPASTAASRRHRPPASRARAAWWERPPPVGCSAATAFAHAHAPARSL